MDSVENRFVEILVCRFGCSRNECKNNMQTMLTQPPFNLQGFDLAYLFVYVENMFSIRFSTSDPLNNGLSTSQQWIDKIKMHLSAK